MKLIEHVVLTDDLSKPWRLYCFSDIHEGNVNVDYETLAEQIREVTENPQALWVYNGDGTEAITNSDIRRFEYKCLHPKYLLPKRLEELAYYQEKEFLATFRPIAEKCICGVGGNHGETHFKQHGLGYGEESKPSLSACSTTAGEGPGISAATSGGWCGR